MWRRVGTVLALGAAALAIGGCGRVGDIFDGTDSFDDRLEAIESVYEQGKDSRRLMDKTGIVVDEGSCASAWVTSGAKDAEDDMGSRYSDVDFQERRKLSFINGCMDRPNKLPPVNAPSLTPTPTAG